MFLPLVLRLFPLVPSTSNMGPLLRLLKVILTLFKKLVHIVGILVQATLVINVVYYICLEGRGGVKITMFQTSD